jgi:tRNA A-37 threonylcarbamoyl transferase component Bud32
MQTVKLSENAVAVLRFCVKGYRMPATDRRLDACRALVDARIMEPVPGSGSE